jgi:thiol:disulfide interchange protein DsbD
MNLSDSHVSLVSAFLGGMGLSFTPCVYPLIPIVAGYIGIRTGRSRLKTLGLAFVYVTGISVTYALLGIFASLSGRLFGSFGSHPVVHIFAGIAVIVFGLSMFDFFTLHVPILKNHRIQGNGGFISTFLFGITSGLIISPCVTPVLGSILLYLSAKNNIVYGGLLLLVFAYGMGFILILEGAFGSLLVRLPRSGVWMGHIKKIYAFILVAAGVWLIFASVRRI